MIVQFLICILQACVVVEQQPYVVYKDVESCRQAAKEKVKELAVLLKDKTVETIAFRCVDKTNNFV
ncbi:hypothetical protein UFOVP371_49 [uncultured Caudovirales phage]|jgi:hypothetical protein|uniref:Uncharacterized protein n=1 Tax=uncultured Caudovirales phage TaxID=2100421 RepID=A0A6J7WYZ3_9CAUD|nr:hypothetical protein UFOVP371_49 [uncultured Caudovirales phage]